MKSDLVYGSLLFVVLEGFEPSQAEPESDVLPLHHRTIPLLRLQRYCFFCYHQEKSQLFFKKITVATLETCPTLSRECAKWLIFNAY